ncbi:MAG: DUF4956 domain-containing protein [Lachnospiraceae bacterium]|jgi:uncharacterized membrane protein YhiD involved in acid resistance|nr:DUF4956 domain-containing protein [Lachnospiraceae bacterium]MCI8995480.1 DUF4956 domain-containing protein [Lachnospiraceae bacterium]MCI9134245.1 DUF4956 domain-containing protein [Lachnospiraceae bacterium]
MEIMDILRKTFLQGYATSDIGVSTIFVCILCTAFIGAYIFVIYKNINKNSFYNRNFNLSLMGMAIITAAIILTIQSNIVVSLGMVGALSIIRFRTAIKDPMDLVFLFWSISVGIICGAGFALIAAIASLALTVVIVIFSMMPESKGTLILVVNAVSHKKEETIMEFVKETCSYVRTRACNVTKTNLNLAIEVRVKDRSALIDGLMEMDGVTSASLVEHDGDVTV